MIISTPPDLHLKYANLAINNNIDFFMELNHSSSHVKQIINKIKYKNIGRTVYDFSGLLSIITYDD